MCGLFGIAATGTHRPSIDADRAAQLRDQLVHRGPDGAGMWAHENVILAHRRLAVIDPTPAGAQPMFAKNDPATGLPRGVLIYNGLLYNDSELRHDLEREGAHFTTQCDTETVLRALEHWGEDALPRMRGMFALAYYEPGPRRLILARDPLGIKPLYYHMGAHEMVFSSAIAPLFGCPTVPCVPFLPMVSAYLTTIRTVFGGWTLFDGIRAVQPGEVISIDLSGEAPVMTARDYATWLTSTEMDEAEAGQRVRDAITDSVQRHLRSDVPICGLLSGGLDSTIITALAQQNHPNLRTYCAGAREDVPEPGALDDDLTCAQRVAGAFGTAHSEAIVTREHFGEQWPLMISALGVPLSTPNEVAIHAVAERLRADGCVVTLSGEGADELFAGYERSLDSAGEFYARRAGGDDAACAMHPAQFEVLATGWMTQQVKSAVVSPRVWHELNNDAWMYATAQCEYDQASQDGIAQGLQAHLRYTRRVNLQGLLQRLDTSTMLAGVEGRTPIADFEVAKLAEALPLSMKFDSTSADENESSGAVAIATAQRTKRVLRSAFADVVPAHVLERPKASFPLPFERWAGDCAAVLERGAFAREMFSAEAIATVTTSPTEHWNLAWPMINLAMWGEKWWG